MGIQTTTVISRDQAEQTVKDVARMYHAKDYRALEDLPGTEDVRAENAVELWRDGVKRFRKDKHVSKASTNRLETIMDLPYFRYSIFENYKVAP